MALIHLLKDVAVNLYKGLIYWFFWAGFVTLRDEMFCTVQKRNEAESRYEIVAGGVADAPVATSVVPDIRTLFRKLQASASVERVVRAMRLWRPIWPTCVC